MLGSRDLASLRAYVRVFGGFKVHRLHTGFCLWGLECFFFFKKKKAALTGFLLSS